MYALRRVRDAFKENRNATDVQQQYKLAQENLELIKRQVSAVWLHRKRLSRNDP